MPPSKPKKLPFQQWYEADFQLSIVGWPEPAEAIYRKLAQTAWGVRALPDSEEKLAKLCRKPLPMFRRYWHSHIREKFIRVKGGGLQNPRVLRDRAAIQLVKLKVKNGGSKGGKQRAKNEAERKAAIAEIHERGNNSALVKWSDVDVSKLVGRK
jgi:hypothetical protein